ncbi:hypothetical protein ND861_19380 [Leptospira sp. 2 VSF19]|uniref:Uncharacterized protein n=1 Tax=Leptospira soteropolitanensis TaxID=2950025 RepID=A0AAW5VUK1_9LEPT|nr:hypothetical protein [Leptospira soteropolitanensis]MCW7494837.1 hypothetical protein [Leptospira soteropolitanensis]MCW7502418.1 hypothetical protein [Leptospira soteropolitanensis]MCW7524658.1 hypothetical protein [Leptospira soteropolitanensis]MCW7528527.1 hypothetical protein [Leptospira soteropolitanensis]MCW7532384.1 hypothetical protein [Leptospira soteropolitanensis]
MQNFEFIPHFAIYQTGAHELVYSENGSIAEIINLQLQYWCDANFLYKNIEKKEKISIQSLIPIFLLLGQSLVTLFGLNNKTNLKDTPPLFQLVTKFVDNNGKKLSSYDRRLYENFKRLDHIYTDLIKHPSSNKMTEILNLKMQDLRQALKTTQEIWIWFLDSMGIEKENYEKYFSENF